MPDPAPLSPQAERTRATILEASLRLFRRDGYEAATMRAIAREAGVSVGNAYYYFGSKEQLLAAFFDQLRDDHDVAATAVLRRERTFAGRLQGVLEAWLEAARPHHAFAAQYDVGASRDRAVEVFDQVVFGSDARLTPALRQALPELLWLSQLAVVTFWRHDASPGQRRSRDVAARLVALLDRLVRLAPQPDVRDLVDDVVALLATLTPDADLS